jgi:hypothetical protein
MTSLLSFGKKKVRQRKPIPATLRAAGETCPNPSKRPTTEHREKTCFLKKKEVEI